MPPPTAERFTVRAVLDRLLAEPPPPADPTEVAAVLAWFTEEAEARVARCPPEALPLRLPKARIESLLACERMTVAKLGALPLSEALVRGRCTDLLVAQHALTGLTADAEDDLRSALSARADHDVLAWIDEADDDGRDRLWRHAGLVREALRTGWGPIDSAWWARPQESVRVPVADGALVLSCTFDLALGGPGTGRPWVLVEVKAGTARDGNRSDLLWYSLVAALRHRRPPDLVVAWSAADDGLVPVPITAGSLEAAGRRALAALDRLVELAAGREPEARPNPRCRWCPDIDRCPPGLASLDAPRTVSDRTYLDDEQDWVADDEAGW
ncbi:MAG: hypothetical protein JO291_12740 [Acidimicrobiia bacterium]|nr:hypothetical protein [Acidimicrobiia bacterium]